MLCCTSSLHRHVQRRFAPYRCISVKILTLERHNLDIEYCTPCAKAGLAAVVMAGVQFEAGFFCETLSKTRHCANLPMACSDCQPGVPTAVNLAALADPVLARQLLPATPDRGTTYQMMPVSRTPSSFTSHDPHYARFRTGLLARQPAKEVTVAQVGEFVVFVVARMI